MSKYTETKIKSKEKFSGRVIQVTLDTVTLPNGKTSTREIVHHGGGAGVLALNGKGEIALVRQYRYALGREMLEIPAGKIEPGEEPIKTALRELREEAACTASSIEEFGQIIPTCGYCNEVIYIYLARGISQSTQNLDEDEFVDFEWMPLDSAVQLVLNGTIDDSKTSYAILKAKILKDSGNL